MLETVCTWTNIFGSVRTAICQLWLRYKNRSVNVWQCDNKINWQNMFLSIPTNMTFINILYDFLCSRLWILMKMLKSVLYMILKIDSFVTYNSSIKSFYTTEHATLDYGLNDLSKNKFIMLKPDFTPFKTIVFQKLQYALCVRTSRQTTNRQSIYLRNLPYSV